MSLLQSGRIDSIRNNNTNIDLTCQYDYFPRLRDRACKRLMMEVHYYDPYQFSGMREDADWVVKNSKATVLTEQTH